MELQTKSGAPVGRALETAAKMATQHKRTPDNIVVCIKTAAIVGS